MRKVNIKTNKIIAKDLQPGDIFSTAGPEYWQSALMKASIGELVYIRTFVSALNADDHDIAVYKIEIEIEETEEGAV
jgi:hypothetical protein